jgi:hypothetical protein
MSFSREGIQDVRVHPLPDAVAPDGQAVGISRSALVTWHSDLKGRFYQVYVNGRLAGTSVNTHQRQMVVQTPSSFESAVHVEVVSVEPTEAHVDFSAQLDAPSYLSTRVRLTLLRSQSLPLDGAFNVYGETATGQIDYDTPLNETPIPIWPCPQDKAGFGLSCFGEGDFGWDAAAAVGFGKGCFASGQFGLDADAIEWISALLAEGAYRFGIRVLDDAGNASPPVESAPVTIVPPARPGVQLSVNSFDPQTGQLTLSVADHL